MNSKPQTALKRQQSTAADLTARADKIEQAIRELNHQIRARNTRARELRDTAAFLATLEIPSLQNFSYKKRVLF